MDQISFLFHNPAATPIMTENGWEDSIAPEIVIGKFEKIISEYLPKKNSWSESIVIFENDFLDFFAHKFDNRAGSIICRLSLKMINNKKELFLMVKKILKIAKKLNLGIWGAISKKYLVSESDIEDEIKLSPAGRLYGDKFKT